jgi:hypothetical protein
MGPISIYTGYGSLGEEGVCAEGLRDGGRYGDHYGEEGGAL